MSRIEDALRRATALSEEKDGASSMPPPPYPSEEGDVDVPDEFRFAEERVDVPEMPLADILIAEPEPAAAPVAAAAPAPVAAPAAASGASRHARWTRAVDDKLVVSDEIKPIAVEQYRRTAAVLHRMQTDGGTRVIMVASAIAGEGKTLTSCNVALTLSESFQRRVLLVDADLRRPAVHQVFKLGNESGLNEALRADTERKLPIVALSPRLSVLTAGHPDPDPMSSLSSERMRKIISEASDRFDWVVLDTPPVALLPDANLLAEMADVVLLVIGAGTTPLHLVERAVKALDRNRIAGVVLNRVVETGPTYAYYQSYTSGKERTAS